MISFLNQPLVESCKELLPTLMITHLPTGAQAQAGISKIIAQIFMISPCIPIFVIGP